MMLELYINRRTKAQILHPPTPPPLTRIEDVAVGSTLTGRVSNVTSFGAFVDIGLGKDGLLHVSKMRGCRVDLGNRVVVKLISKDPQRGKISLELVSLL
uniref:S1 RNA-binding domain-containing protein 1 n=1 Tax=Acartia pacifica TaxID=335913 RepID=A0A0U2UMN3_ACAPC|nr:S1 RNA-binding domain-containing protein 1 [Acartia pacifica]